MMKIRYNGKRVVAIRKRQGTATGARHGYVVVEGFFGGQKVYEIDKDTYAQIAIPLLFESFKGWQMVLNTFDELTVQLAVEIERAGLVPEKEYERTVVEHIGVTL